MTQRKLEIVRPLHLKIFSSVDALMTSYVLLMHRHLQLTTIFVRSFSTKYKHIHFSR